MPPERRPVVGKQKGGRIHTAEEQRKGHNRPSKPKEKDESIIIGEYVNALEEYKIAMRDASVLYIPDSIDRETSMQWYNELSRLSTWYQPTLKVYGKSIIQSREIAAYTPDPELVVKYSGTTVKLHTDYPPVLAEIQNFVEKKLGVQFHHVMLNRYGSGDVHIGLHADGLENRVIATLSLGADRTFIMRHRTAKGDQGLKKWKLKDGSLFVMQGETQRFWKHEIPREPKVKEGRISLTFRRLES